MRGSAKRYFHFLCISADSKQEFVKKSFSSFVEFELFLIKTDELEVCKHQQLKFVIATAKI